MPLEKDSEGVDCAVQSDLQNAVVDERLHPTLPENTVNVRVPLEAFPDGKDTSGRDTGVAGKGMVDTVDSRLDGDVL